jgi:hypothetical protein
MEDIIKQITGKLFKDGPYEYQIYIKSGDLGLGAINSISIFVENIPDHIGIDILLYAMGNLIDIAGEELKNSEDEFMINKIIIEGYPTLGDMLSAMNFTTEFGVRSFTQLNNSIMTYKDKKIDLKDINQKSSSRINKLTKAMDYIANTFTSPIEGIETNLSYKISGKPTRLKNSITPALRLDVKITTDKGVSIDQKTEISKIFKDQLQEISPIQIQSYDILVIVVDFKPKMVNGLVQIKA